MPSDQSQSPAERRREKRLAGGGFPLLVPSEATIVDCARRGVGIETRSHLAVGSVTSVNLFLPAGELELRGRVRWARLVGNRQRGAGESAPVFRVGLSFLEGQPLADWDRVRWGLTSSRPQRRIVRWRRPSLF